MLRGPRVPDHSGPRDRHPPSEENLSHRLFHVKHSLRIPIFFLMGRRSSEIPKASGSLRPSSSLNWRRSRVRSPYELPRMAQMQASLDPRKVVCLGGPSWSRHRPSLWLHLSVPPTLRRGVPKLLVFSGGRRGCQDRDCRLDIPGLRDVPAQRSSFLCRMPNVSRGLETADSRESPARSRTKVFHVKQSGCFCDVHSEYHRFVFVSDAGWQSATPRENPKRPVKLPAFVSRGTF